MIQIGTKCVLNSGGPEMLVVDFTSTHVCCAWIGGEAWFPIACVTWELQNDH